MRLCGAAKSIPVSLVFVSGYPQSPFKHGGRVGSARHAKLKRDLQERSKWMLTNLKEMFMIEISKFCFRDIPQHMTWYSTS